MTPTISGQLADTISGQLVDLAVVSVRTFQRTVRTRQGPRVEVVRGHTENRQGWIPQPDWLAGERAWIAKGEAAWNKNAWKPHGKPKPAEQIARDLKDTAARLNSWGGSGYIWASSRLMAAQPYLHQHEMAKAYHQLAQAHQAIAENALPAAEPEQYPQIAGHLQRIAGHMQDLDRAMGASPQLTRTTLGSFGEIFQHAGQARRETQAGEWEQRAADAWPAPASDTGPGAHPGARTATVDDILNLWHATAGNDAAAQHLNRAAAALNDGRYDTAATLLNQASSYLRMGRAPLAAEHAARLAASLTPGSRTAAAVAGFAERGRDLVPRLLGGGRQDWNGNVDLFGAADRPRVAAEMRWDGTMGFQRELAGKIRADAESGGTIADPDPYVNALHELIHGTVPHGQTHAMHAKAYQDPANAAIEEGFTELGTVHHAPGFFKAAGIGDRPTSVMAVKGGRAVPNPDYGRKRDAVLAGLQAGYAQLMADGRPPQRQAAKRLSDAAYDLELGDPHTALDALAAVQHLGDPQAYEAAIRMKAQLRDLLDTPAARPATMSEYAARLQDPVRVAQGEAWGHYGWQTAAAQDWAIRAAHAEGKGPRSARVRELADEVNREGVGGKVPAMARQAIRAAGADPAKFQGAPFVALEQRIRSEWPQGPAADGKMRSPWASALAAVRQYDRDH